MKKKTKTISAMLFCLYFSGCAVGPRFEKPVVETPENYRFETVESEAAADLKWWELFDDPALQRLISAALENNRDIKIAASRIDQARARLGFVDADRYPGMDVEGGAARGNFWGGGRSDDTDSRYYLAAPVSWEIDFWGKLKRSSDAARAELLGTEYSLKSVQLSIVSEVAANYHLLLDYRQRLEISKNTLVSRNESLDIIRKRFEKGIIPEIDLNQSQIQKEIAASAIPLYERAIAKTENILRFLTGELPGPIETGKGLDRQQPPPVIPAGMPSTLLERRPDVMEAMYALKAQVDNVAVAEALRLPSFSLTAVVGVASTQFGSNRSEGGAWSVGGGLLGPVIDFHKNLRRVEIEKAVAEQTLLFYENTVLNAFKDVEDALVEIETYKRQVAAVENRGKAASNANRLSKIRYDKGVTSYLEVLETERELFSVELELSELRQNYLNAYVNLYKALGGGWIEASGMKVD